MTNKNYTDITLVVDRSGSMSSIKEATEKGLRTFIGKHREAVGANDTKTRITYAQFDTVYEMLVRGSDISAFDLPPFEPRGWTALYDAIGSTIVDTGNRLRDLSEQSRPGKVLFVIVTDGEENSSREYTSQSRIAKMIDEQQNRYSWEFVFIGANINAQERARGFHIPTINSMTFGANAAGAKAAWDSVTTNTVAYSTGLQNSSSFNKADYDTQLKVGGVENIVTK